MDETGNPIIGPCPPSARGLPPSFPGMSPQPFVGGVTHRLFRAVPEPGHEVAVEFEVVAAFLREEAADILGVSVGAGDRGRAGYSAAMPIERRHRRRLFGGRPDAVSHGGPLRRFWPAGGGERQDLVDQ